jgi:hypothetical protein
MKKRENVRAPPMYKDSNETLSSVGRNEDIPRPILAEERLFI